MQEKQEIDSAGLLQTPPTRQTRFEDSRFQSKFFSAYQNDRLINKEEFQIFRQKFKELNTRMKPDGTVLTLGCSLQDLFHFGPAFPQFFSFLIYLIIGFAFFALVFAIPSIIINYQASSSCLIEACRSLNFFEKIGIYPGEIMAEQPGSASHTLRTEAYIFFTYSYLAALYCYYIFYRLRHFVSQCMEKVSTPSDYALLVDGFPEPVLEAVVEEFFKENFPNIKIESVVTIPSFSNTPIGRKTFGSCILVLETHSNQLDLLRAFHADRGSLLRACTNTPRYEGHKITVSRSPDPQDLLIDNFGVSKKRVIIKSFIFIVIMAVVVVLCILSQVGLRDYSDIAYVWLSLLAVIENKFILYVCKMYVKSTKPITNTGSAWRFVWTAGVAQFINLALSPLVNYLMDDNGDSDAKQLYKELAINTCFQTIVPQIFLLINIAYRIRANERKDIEVEIESETFTLSHLRKAFLNPEFHIEEYYSVLLSVSLLAALEGPQNPIIYLFVVAMLTSYYWILKRHFIYYTLTPIKFSAMLVENAGNFVFLIPVFNLVGFRVFLALFAQSGSIIDEIAIVNTVAILGLPVILAMGHCFLRYKTNIDYESKRELLALTYNQAKEKFRANFRTDFEVAINSLLDFRLEIMSFS